MPLRQKILLFFLGLVVVHILIEVGLTLAGQLILAGQAQRNQTALARSDGYTILCVGESTTMLGGEEAYPRQLERVLASRFPRDTFRVINAGVAGKNTDYILANIQEDLDTYKPDLVVAMIGINDNCPFTTRPRHPLLTAITQRLSRLQTVKLYRWLGTALKNRKAQKSLPATAETAPSTPEPDPNAVLKLSLAKQLMEQGDFARAEALLKHILEKGYFPQLTEALSQQLTVCFFRQNKMDEYIDSFIHIPISSWDLYHFLDGCSDPAYSPKIQALIQRMIEQRPDVAGFYEMLADCTLRSNPKADVEDLHAKSRSLLEDQIKTCTQKNAAQLVRIFHTRGVQMIFMQYPLRDLNLLKTTLQESEYFGEITFVGNETNFKDALKTAPFEEYFTDRFAGDFGHCTPKGNRLIAENVADVIEKILKLK